MIHTVAPAGRAVRWDGSNPAEIETVCDGRTVRMHLFDEASIVIDAWGAPQCVSLGDWVFNHDGSIRVVTRTEFAARWRITGSVISRRHQTTTRKEAA